MYLIKKRPHKGIKNHTSQSEIERLLRVFCFCYNNFFQFSPVSAHFASSMSRSYLRWTYQSWPVNCSVIISWALFKNDITKQNFVVSFRLADIQRTIGYKKVTRCSIIFQHSRTGCLMRTLCGTEIQEPMKMVSFYQKHFTNWCKKIG